MLKFFNHTFLIAYCLDLDRVRAVLILFKPHNLKIWCHSQTTFVVKSKTFRFFIHCKLIPFLMVVCQYRIDSFLE